MAMVVNDDDDVVHKEQDMGEKESSPKLRQKEVALTLSWAKTLIDIAAPKELVSVAVLNPHVPFLPPRAS